MSAAIQCRNIWLVNRYQIHLTNYLLRHLRRKIPGYHLISYRWIFWICLICRTNAWKTITSLFAVSNSTEEGGRVDPYDEPTYKTELWHDPSSGLGGGTMTIAVRACIAIHFCVNSFFHHMSDELSVLVWSHQMRHVSVLDMWDDEHVCLDIRLSEQVSPLPASNLDLESVAQDVMEEWTLHWW